MNRTGYSVEVRKLTAAIEGLCEAQVETEQIETLIETQITQLKGQAAVLGVARSLIRQHRQTLRTAAGTAEAA